MKKKDTSQTKMLRVLRELAPEVIDGLPLGGISRATGLEPNALIPYLSALIDFGWVEKMGSGVYRLKPEFFSCFATGLAVSEISAMELLTRTISGYRGAINKPKGG